MPMLPFARPQQNAYQPPNLGMEQLIQMRKLVSDMRGGRTPRATSTAPAGLYAGGINQARNEVQASGAVGRPGMGLLTNTGAQDVYSRGGYMPTMTVGGNWGQSYGDPVTPTMERNQLRLGAVNARLERAGRPAAGVNPQALMRGQQAMQGMQAAGIGQIDPATGAFVGNSALGLLGDARGQRVAGMVGRGPSYQAPSEATLAENAEAYGARRAGVMADRRAGVVERGQTNAEARRVRMGNLTFDERLLAGQPGLGVAREQAGAMRDVAGIQAGVGRQGIEAQERMATARNALDQAIASGNARAITKAAKLNARAQADAAKFAAAPGLAQTEAYRDVEGKKYGLLEREQSTRERQTAIQQADQYRQQARDAAAAGDYESYQRYTEQANGLTGGAAGAQAAPGIPQTAPNPQAGLPGVNQPQSWAQIPQTIRQQIVAGGPEQMVANLRTMFPGMPQEVADAMIQEAFPGTGVSQYDPDGYGISNVIGTMTGWENLNRWRAAAGNGPQPPAYIQAPGLIGVAQNWLGY